MKCDLYTDGGARGNPGPAAVGGVLKDEAGKTIDSFKAFLGVATNNVAEYTALIYGLKLAKEKEVTDLTCYLDSELVVKQLKGEYRVKNTDLKLLYAEVNKLLSGFDKISFVHVTRDKNQNADRLVNEVLDSQSK